MIQQITGQARERACIASTAEKTKNIPQLKRLGYNFQARQARVRDLLTEEKEDGGFFLRKAETCTDEKKVATAKAFNVILLGLGDVSLVAVIRNVAERKKMCIISAVSGGVKL